MREANDRAYVGSQYRDAANLGARQRFHQLYSENEEGWSSWVFRNLNLPETGSVLELGCGNCQLWLDNIEKVRSSLQITLTDLSPGLLNKAKESLDAHAGRFRFELVDACRIPYDAGTFDLVIANHMLYHLGDLDAALSGIRRALKPAGSLYASTVGSGNMGQLQEFISRSGWEVDLDLSSAAKAFGLENGEGILRRHFEQVELLTYPDSLMVPNPEAVIEYLSSLFPSREVPARLLQTLQEEVDRRGVIRISKSLGMFRCR